MSLSTAFHRAQNIFSNASEQLSTLVKNIENSGNKSYVRRDIMTTQISNGITGVAQHRTQDQNMFQKVLDTNSLAAGQQKIFESFESLRELMGADNSYQNSPSQHIAKLHDSLQAYANNSFTTLFGKKVVEDAEMLVNCLKESSKEIQKIRKNADREIDQEIAHLRQFLSEFTAVNNEIKLASSTMKSNHHELLDRRDSLLQKISNIIGINTITRNNDDTVIYTSDGTTLFETVPRNVTFVMTESYNAAVAGKPVIIDGVMVSGSKDIHTVPKGKIKALLQIRDGIASIFQNQQDEMARGLVSIFSEKDPKGRLEDVAGLFVADAPKFPSGQLYKGISELIYVNPRYQSNPDFIRDGGSISKDYIWNSQDASSYSDLINHYNKSLSEGFVFDPTARIDNSVSLLEYGRNSIGWLEQNRSNSYDSHTRNQVLFNHVSESYSNKTGVNLQEELSFLIQVEQSYNVSNKLMVSINNMLNTLLEGVR
ncbi:MAG: flagellar hook-associated protein FlgK [Candidatus Liberibacter ctenarytainae]|uniref:Flagellar hook-associated protein 1 n=1 Tax=Candidatus Liberibacter ctenarytainae TaxID=2020335 RepID=A0A937DLF2_9HYPH|nr:flagellar hook-associated protein FlgK [Candidatus Liberibacter ctenarytainae]